MKTDFQIRRPALSGIESAAYGVIGLAGLVSILFAATPILDMAPEGSQGTTVSYRSNSVPRAPHVAVGAPNSSLTSYPRAI